MKLSTKANAKINLYLDVTGILENGYHKIKSVMQSISLSDTVSAEMLAPSAGECTVELTCSVPTLPCNEKNLGMKAARAFFSAAEIPEYCCRIHIEKNIPVAAGLAGGSADCAAVLRLLNELYGSPFDASELCRIGARLGADVPFCIIGGTCLAEGIGEILTPLPELPDIYTVVAIGGEGVSTPEAYGLIDSTFEGRLNEDHGEFAVMYGALSERKRSTISASLYNIFEEVILPRRPVASAIVEKLKDSEATGVLMSGSGPSVFGFFKSREEAASAAKKVLSVADSVFLCSTDRCTEFIKF